MAAMRVFFWPFLTVSRSARTEAGPAAQNPSGEALRVPRFTSRTTVQVHQYWWQTGAIHRAKAQIATPVISRRTVNRIWGSRIAFALSDSNGSTHFKHGDQTPRPRIASRCPYHR